jgi:hypothetical protein
VRCDECCCDELALNAVDLAVYAAWKIKILAGALGSTTATGWRCCFESTMAFCDGCLGTKADDIDAQAKIWCSWLVLRTISMVPLVTSNWR